jgi:K+-sensing histidine kinase KdpD
MDMFLAQQDEMQRMIELSELDLDYSSLHDSFSGLARLAAGVAGTAVSLVNLVDAYTVWTISSYGISIRQQPRENAVCHYTLHSADGWEIKDLAADDRFRTLPYVNGEPGLRYYFGIPLQTSAGHDLGTLCVLDKKEKEITPEKKQMLHIIAHEIVNRLLTLKTIRQLRMQIRESHDVRKKLAHDIRGPLGGIIGLTNIISQQGNANRMEEVLEFINLIQKSSSSILGLAEGILGTGKTSAGPDENEYTLAIFRHTLEQLYSPQALGRQVDFSVETSSENQAVIFPKYKLLQVAGNLVSHAIRFTPAGGKVSVYLDLQPGRLENLLSIRVTDTGAGMLTNNMAIITGGNLPVQDIHAEQEYDLMLSLVKHLTEGMRGTLTIESQEGKGTVFSVQLPVKRG